LGAALEDVELVESPFAVVALLGGEKEVPLLPVGQDGQWHALMEGVLEELAVRSLALPDLLDLDQYHWLSRWVAQRVVGSPST
jgi:hypothetical protein